MKKKIMLILIMVFLVGCTQQEKQFDREPDEIGWIPNNKYKVDKIENSDINGPSGILIKKDKLILCNSLDNNLLILSLTGETIKSVGNLGNEFGAFINPMAIFDYEDNIYVLDTGNNRVQIFDEAFNFQREVKLNIIDDDRDAVYLDAVHSDGMFYITSNSLAKSSARLTCIKDNRQLLSDNNFYGRLYADDSNTYAIDSLELYYGEKNVESAISGNNSLYKIDDKGSFVKLADMPYGYTPTGFVIKGDVMYVLTTSLSRLDKFDMSGNYIETIAKFDKLSLESYLAVTDDDKFYVADRDNNVFYFVH